MRSLSIAATGMLAQQTNVDVISNNIANMNTTAYKRQRAEFQDLLYQQVQRPGAATGGQEARSPSGIQIGAGVRTGGVYRIGEQGAMVTTSNRYDVAIEGQGYFQVTIPSGDTACTRSGSFQLSDQDELVTADGYAVQPGITVPPGATDVVISRTGKV
jgi:flagellar basal-body rod protein FlgG